MSPLLVVLSHALLVLVLPFAGLWPLDPRPDVVAGFSPPATTWSAGHRGVDLLGSPGQQVRATAAGRVSYAAPLAGRGVVVIDHGATRTTYEPVRAVVHVGDRVRAGQVLGELELFGSHCWPRACLHWGLVRGATYLDPLTLVGVREVRLLPLVPLSGEATDVPPAPSPGEPVGPPRDVLAGSRQPTSGRTPAQDDVPLRSLWSRFARPWGAPAGTPVASGRW